MAFFHLFRYIYEIQTSHIKIIYIWHIVGVLISLSQEIGIISFLYLQKTEVRFLCHGLNQPEVNCVLTEIGWPRLEIFKSFSFLFIVKSIEHKKLTSKANKRLQHFICLTSFFLVWGRIYKLTQPIRYLSPMFNFFASQVTDEVFCLLSI